LRGNDDLLEISSRDCVSRRVAYVDADLLPGLTDSSRTVVGVTRVSSSTRECNVATPLVAFVLRALDEQDFRVAVPHPILREEGIQPLGLG
jgi:hypothetical protein